MKVGIDPPIFLPNFNRAEFFFKPAVLAAAVAGEMFQKNKAAKTVRPAAEAAAAEYGCSVVSLSFVREKDGPVLKLVIDGDDLSLDTCADVSSKFSEWLDAHEKDIPFDGYVLEVSSPGPERPLVTREDFERFIGKTALIITKNKAADGRKRYLGRIKAVGAETVTVYVEKESAEFALEFTNISKARLEYEF